MKTKELVQVIAKSLGLSLSDLGTKIGRGGGSSMARSLRDDSLKVADLKKCFNCDGQELIIKYKGKNIKID